MSCIQHGERGINCGPECSRLTRIYENARRRAAYRFVSGGEVLTWQRQMSGDSRVEEVTCDAGWFYGQMIGARS